MGPGDLHDIFLRPPARFSNQENIQQQQQQQQQQFDSQADFSV